MKRLLFFIISLNYGLEHQLNQNHDELSNTLNENNKESIIESSGIFSKIKLSSLCKSFTPKKILKIVLINFCINNLKEKNIIQGQEIDFNNYYRNFYIKKHCDYQQELMDFWWPNNTREEKFLGLMYNNIIQDKFHPLSYSTPSLKLNTFIKSSIFDDNFNLMKAISSAMNKMIYFNFDKSSFPYSIVNNFMDQQFSHYKIYNSYDDCYDHFFNNIDTNLNKNISGKNLRTLKTPNVIPTKNNTDLYDFIIRSNINGNLLGVKGVFNITNNNFSTPMYIGRSIDKNGLINSNYQEYFFEKPSLKFNLKKKKIIDYENIFYGNKNLTIRCSSLLNNINFLNENSIKSFYLCQDRNNNTNNILINGNDFANKIVNIIGYIVKEINFKVYNYTPLNQKNLWFNGMDLLDQDYLKMIPQYEISGKSYDICSDPVSSQGHISFAIEQLKKPGVLDGSILSLRLQDFTNGQNKLKEINGEFKFLSWIMDLSFYKNNTNNPNFYFLDKGYYYYARDTSSRKEEADGFFLLSSCGNPDIFKYKNPINYTNSLNGQTFIKENGLNLDVALMDNTNNTLWFVSDEKFTGTKLKDTFTRIKNSQLWDGSLLTNVIDNYKMVFPKDFNLFSIYNINNNTDKSFTEVMMDINFLPNDLEMINYNITDNFVSIHNNHYLTENSYNFIINLYNSNEKKILWNKLEYLNNNFIGCNHFCFYLNFQGFPIEKIDNLMEKNIIINNKFNKNLNKFENFNFNLNNQWNLNNKEQYPCNLNYINNTNIVLICFYNTINDFNNIYFMYDIEKKQIFYDFQQDAFFWILNTIDGDRIYISKLSNKGFSSKFNKLYSPLFFNYVKSNNIVLNDFSNTQNITIPNSLMGFYLPSQIIIHNDNNIDFSIEKTTKFKKFDQYLILGNGNNGLSKICKINEESYVNSMCGDGDDLSLTLYYNQNFNNNLQNITNFNFKNISIDDWFNKKQEIFNGNIIENQWFGFYKHQSNYNITTKYKFNDKFVECFPLMNKWSFNLPNNNSDDFSLGAYCNFNKSKFIELLLYPQYDNISKSIKQITSPWFLCEKNDNNCKFYLINGSEILCDSINCKQNNFIFNNNFIDYLNDEKIINFLNTKYQLNVEKLISIHPHSEFFIKSFFNFEKHTKITQTYIIESIKNFNDGAKLRAGIFVLNIIPIFILYYLRKTNSLSKIFKCLYLMDIILIWPYIWLLVDQIKMIQDKNYKNINHNDFIYDDIIFKKINDFFIANISFIMLYFGCFLFLFISMCRQSSITGNYALNQKGDNEILLMFQGFFFIAYLILTITNAYQLSDPEIQKIIKD